MWQLINRTPFAAERGWIRDIDGREIWIVAVKATYDIDADGRTRIAAEQPPINSGPVADDKGNLLCETDLGPPKNATDILLCGHAYAPGGKPVHTLKIGFGVDKLQRTALVTGDRQWQFGLLYPKASEPQPFTRMPLTWSRAVGGDEQRGGHATGNPIGCGLRQESGSALPNIESLDKPLRSPQERPPAIGFGPVPRHWPWRLRHAGTYDERWQATRSPLLPEDLDPRYWQIAPPEQQYPGKLRGGEPVALINLVPPAVAPEGILRFRLPRVSLGFTTRFYDNTQARSRASIHTVILEPDFPRVGIVYHMALPCHPQVNLLERTLVTIKERPLDKDAPTPAVSGEAA